MWSRWLAALIAAVWVIPAAGQTCASLAPSADRAFLIGSFAGGGPYRLLVNGVAQAEGRSAQTLLLHFDGDTGAAAQADGVRYAAGRFGQALALDPKGTLAYARDGALDLREGTIEMWAAPRENGDSATYAARDQALFSYRAPNGDNLNVAASRTAGILYAGGTVRGQWESAYGGKGSMRAWKAGEWHHLSFTFSEAANEMKFYVDGVLAANTNERHYWAPDAGGARFTLGGTAGAGAAFLLDEVRILSRPMSADEVKASAGRTEATRDNEIWFPAANLANGDRVALEAGACASAALVWRGVPLRNATPMSTLLPPGSTALDFAVDSIDPTSCAYRVGGSAAVAFDAGQGASSHRTKLRGLSADPTVVNRVAISCASDPDYTLTLLYRALPRGNARFPRKGNLWGSTNMAQKGLAYASKIDLYLGATFSADEIRRLRSLNPEILILTSINTVENSGLPEDYYLHDTTGRRIEVWPGTYRLNLTKQYVAEYQARFAYQTMLDAGLMADGCFFDNFFTTQSWLKADIYGRAVELDADEDGKPDDPAWLDREWGKGVYHELETWRSLMPWALASGHLPRPPQQAFADIFNGDSIGFMTSDALEGKTPFQNLWDTYNNWFTMGRKPTIMMIESTPQDQISYGYGYEPWKMTPASTLTFAASYYPNVRFGLGVTLMNDGYFAHEFGDTWHGNDWWYDELDYDLGRPLGPAERVLVAPLTTANLVENGGFEQPFGSLWRLSVVAAGGAQAKAEIDYGNPAAGAAAAHITVTNAGQGVDWHVELGQHKRHLQQGMRYDLTFAARAAAARPISVSTQQDVAPWKNYGLSRQVSLDPSWKQFTVTFTANTTADDARLQFWFGATTGEVWLDEIRLVEHPPDIYRREFDNGMALLNATGQAQTIQAGAGWRRLKGGQAARYEHIVDDTAAGFSATGVWATVKYDTGEWHATPPFYHAWNGQCRQSDQGDGRAEWDLAIPADDTYTFAVWWAAAPGQSGWTKKAVYEVVADGRVVASATLDQSTAGDEWHSIGTMALSAKDAPMLRVHSEGSGPLVADAVWVRSASRYNDGSAARSVTLAPMDAIVLARDGKPLRRIR